MATQRVNKTLFAFCRETNPDIRTLEAFDTVISSHSNQPWVVSLVPSHYSAWPFNSPHISGYHPQAGTEDCLLESIKAYFERRPHGSLEYAEIKIYEKKPLSRFSRGEWADPVPAVFSDIGTIGKLFDEALRLMDERHFGKVYLASSGVGIGTLSKKSILRLRG